jgi:hypothetical protein
MDTTVHVKRPLPACQRGVEPLVTWALRPEFHHGGHIPQMWLAGIRDQPIPACFEFHLRPIVGADHAHDGGVANAPLHLKDRPLDLPLEPGSPHGSISTPQQVAAPAQTLVRLNWWCIRPVMQVRLEELLIACHRCAPLSGTWWTSPCTAGCTQQDLSPVASPTPSALPTTSAGWLRGAYTLSLGEESRGITRRVLQDFHSGPRQAGASAQRAVWMHRGRCAMSMGAVPASRACAARNGSLASGLR